MRRIGPLLLLLLVPCSSAWAAVPDVQLFLEAGSADEKTSAAALEAIAAAGWRDGYAALLVDVARFLPRIRRAQDPIVDETGPADEAEGSAGTSMLGAGGHLEAGSVPATNPRAKARERIVRFLEKQTGQGFGEDLRRWRRWIWQRADEPHPRYATFKAQLYAAVDPRMASFFPDGARADVRLDEIDWGGVKVNGIPPLDHPKVVAGKDATFLQDKNVVFGVVRAGEARAYPKRILGWHELVRDRVGGEELTVVYCALCGTVIPYASEVAGRTLHFGTSGLLYRSNKLMFDEETGSLWSTSEGRPVLGALVGTGFELRAHAVVTTTWREWLKAHPETTVLSLDTGYTRDYSEGAAYREYFASERLMFEVPKPDDRLRNKAEVLALLLRPDGVREGPRLALAIATDLLRKNPVYRASFAGYDLVVVTSPDGANRVYAAAGQRFLRLDESGRAVVDDRGQSWEIDEEALVPGGRDEPAKRRLPARRAFWFGWHAQFPDTELLK